MSFPDCTLITCEQRSPEWYEHRRGYLTASQFGDWITKSGKTADKAMLTAASKCLADEIGSPDPAPFETDDMRRGIAMEPIALGLFSQEFGVDVTPIGFAVSIHGKFGCSPDGLMMKEGEGVEVKCPRLSRLIQYKQLDVLPDEYAAQVHGSMAVTGAKVWWFVAYHPLLPLFTKRVVRDAYTEEMLAGLKAYDEFYNDLTTIIEV